MGNYPDPQRVGSRNVNIYPLASGGAPLSGLSSTGFFQTSYEDSLLCVTFRQIFEELGLAFWWPLIDKNLDKQSPDNELASSITLVWHEDSEDSEWDSSYRIMQMQDYSDEAVYPGTYTILKHIDSNCSSTKRDKCPHLLAVSSTGSVEDKENCKCISVLELEPNASHPILNTLEVTPDSMEFCEEVTRHNRRCRVTGQDNIYGGASPTPDTYIGPGINVSYIVPFSSETQGWSRRMMNAVWLQRVNEAGMIHDMVTLGYDLVTLGINCPENGICLRRDLDHLFKGFYWSVNPKTMRIRVFVNMNSLLPFHGQDINMHMSNSKGHPPPQVWAWHYGQAVLRMLRSFDGASGKRDHDEDDKYPHKRQRINSLYSRGSSSSSEPLSPVEFREPPAANGGIPSTNTGDETPRDTDLLTSSPRSVGHSNDTGTPRDVIDGGHSPDDGCYNGATQALPKELVELRLNEGLMTE